jgi:hypothetical protein
MTAWPNFRVYNSKWLNFISTIWKTFLKIKAGTVETIWREEDISKNPSQQSFFSSSTFVF